VAGARRDDGNIGRVSRTSSWRVTLIAVGASLLASCQASTDQNGRITVQLNPALLGVETVATFNTHWGPSAVLLNKVTGNYQFVFGRQSTFLLDRPQPQNISVVGLDELGPREILILRGSFANCPVSYAVWDITRYPLRTWRVGDCQRELSFSRVGNDLLAENVNEADPKTWVYSNGSLYGPRLRSTLLASRNPAPPALPRPTYQETSPAPAQAPASPRQQNSAPAEASNSSDTATQSAATSSQAAEVHQLVLRSTPVKPIEIQPSAAAQPSATPTFTTN